MKHPSLRMCVQSIVRSGFIAQRTESGQLENTLSKGSVRCLRRFMSIVGPLQQRQRLSPNRRTRADPSAGMRLLRKRIRYANENFLTPYPLPTIPALHLNPHPSPTRKQPLAGAKDIANSHKEDQDISQATREMKDQFGMRKSRQKLIDHRKRRESKFIDQMTVKVYGGNGGDGSVAFHREAFLEKGPPSGGNGGPGGNVRLVVDPTLTSLVSVPAHVRAQPGKHGRGAFAHGRKGEDQVIRVPVGTIVRTVDRKVSTSQPPSSYEKIAAEAHADPEGVELPDDLISWRKNTFLFHPSQGRHVDQSETFRNVEKTIFKEDQRRRWREKRYPPSANLEVDLTEPTPPGSKGLVLAQGGPGGRGNPTFPYPNFIATRGLAGEMITYELELKLIADVGFVGLPNAGKSTLLRCLTNAKVHTADYAFTTISPQLGQVTLYSYTNLDNKHIATSANDFQLAVKNDGDILDTQGSQHAEVASAQQKAVWSGEGREGEQQTEKDQVKRQRMMDRPPITFTIADNPGLIEDAAENRGLGHSFLRSIERCHLLVYVIDISANADGIHSHEPGDALKILVAELEKHKEGLSKKGCIIVANKADLLSPEEGRKRLQSLSKTAAKVLGEPVNGRSFTILPISARRREGVEYVARYLGLRMEDLRSQQAQVPTDGPAGSEPEVKVHLAV